MKANGYRWQRWVTGACLAVALVLLLLGETWLKHRLQGFDFLAYWGGCFCCTALAIFFAGWELRCIRRAALEEQEALAKSTWMSLKEELPHASVPARRRRR